MKRVICIDDGENKFGVSPPLEYGVEYEVKEVHEFPSMKAYELVEPNSYLGIWVCFGVHRFIPLSEIDETQMERNYQKEKV